MVADDDRFWRALMAGPPIDTASCTWPELRRLRQGEVRQTWGVWLTQVEQLLHAMRRTRSEYLHAAPGRRDEGFTHEGVTWGE